MSVNRLDRGDKDIVLLALATLALDRPGWEQHCVKRIADLLFPGSTATLDEFIRLNKDRFAARPPLPLGPTGDFPRGTLPGVKDEGALNLGVVVRNGTVIVAFGTPTSWIGLPPQQARELGQSLIVRAEEAGKVS